MKNKFLGKDFNQELEEILEAKNFKENVRNSLLSILYKIEVGYKDYQNTKREVCLLEEYVKLFFDTLEKNCENITIYSPMDKQAQTLEKTKKKYKIVTNENGKKAIFSYPMEEILLQAVWETGKDTKDNVLEDTKEIIQEAIKQVLEEGYFLDKVEPVKDFNGWSWNIPEKKNLSYINIVYTNLLLLLGEEYISSIYKQDKLEEKIREKLSKIYGENIANEFVDSLIKLCVFMYLQEHKDLQELFKKKKEEHEAELEKMNQKKEFLENLTKKKKQIIENIRKLDEVLNTPEKLKDEYLQYNKQRPNEEKIFSVSHYEERLENIRNKQLEELNICSKMQEPSEYVKCKTKLEENLEFFSSFTLEERKKKELDIAFSKLESKFLECFIILIDRCEEKRDLINLIYEMRYYAMLPRKENKVIGQDLVLKGQIDKVESHLLKKAWMVKAIQEPTAKESINILVLSYVFKTRMLNLEDLQFVFRKDSDDNVIVEYYDGDLLEKSKSLPVRADKTLHIRFNKKIYMF